MENSVNIKNVLIIITPHPPLPLGPQKSNLNYAAT